MFFCFSKYLTSQNHQNRHPCVPLYVRISSASVWQASFPLPTRKMFYKSQCYFKGEESQGLKRKKGG